MRREGSLAVWATVCLTLLALAPSSIFVQHTANAGARVPTNILLTLE